MERKEIDARRTRDASGGREASTELSEKGEALLNT
jgi:hypothetical protein